MQRLINLATVLILVNFLSACQSLSTTIIPAGESLEKQGSPDPFVRVDGVHFTKDGEPYYYVGTNFWYGAYLGMDGIGQKRLVDELDQLKALGINNLRILAVSEQTSLTMAVRPAMQVAPGNLNPKLLQGLDVLLDEMSKRDMLAVLYLNNFWQWSGGMAQYMSWLNGTPPFDPDTTGDWNGFMQNSAAFYRSDEAQKWYREAVEQVVTRTNSVNGKRYIDDPTIMSWQLANEPRPGSDQAGRPYYSHYKNWILNSARFIKSLDKNHLVSTGSEGMMGTLQDLQLYKDAHDTDAVDYLTFHLWPKNWSWLDINNVEGTYASALVKSKAYILQHVQIAEQLNKPIVLEEFGIERDAGLFSPSASTEVRDKFYSELFAMVEHQAKLGSPVAGTNFWTWGGLGKAMSDDFIWHVGDPFTGDPPQEAQGLNSVFASDASTLTVIKRHAEFMNSL